MAEFTLLHTNYIVLGSLLLASSALLLSQFFFATIATPVESPVSPDVSVKAPLVARGGPTTYTGTDTNANASLVGTYTCYKEGTWVRQSEMDIPINHTCGQPVYSVPQFTPFGLKPNADGAYPPEGTDYDLSWRCFDISTGCDSNIQNNDVYIYLNGDALTPAHANVESCEYALGRARDLCHGDNGYTRGGWFTFLDGASYGFDPQRNGKNQ